MAKRKGRLHRPAIADELAVGALAAGDVISAGAPGIVGAREYLIGIRAVWSFDAFTTGEGPIQFGVAHADYLPAEIEEALEANAAWDLGNLIAQEQTRRKVRTVGVFKPSVGGPWNDGRPVFTKCGWYLEDGDAAFTLWARNLDLLAPLTTGGIIHCDGNGVLRPVT